MLTKIINLGCEAPETGEPRVQLLHNELIKTASTEIQEFWDALERDPSNAWLWVIGVSAMEYYGCNNNGDAFTEADLKSTHCDFVQNAHVFLQHVNKDPAKSIGKPVFSWFNDAMHRVELILRIDKSVPSSAETVRKIKAGEPIYVSMGCTVAYDVCSICGNKAPSRKDYCDHLRYNMKKILPDGKQVYALNPNPKFFDISIVARPADPTAFTLDKAASLRGTSTAQPEYSSAELGELYKDTSLKLASLKKISDIVKRVDGDIVDVCDADNPNANEQIDAVSTVRNAGFETLDYPEMPYSTLTRLQISPASFLTIMSLLGAPLTLGDAAWMAGSQAFGHCPEPAECHSMFRLLPVALRHLLDCPAQMDNFLQPVCASYHNELDEPVRRMLVIKVIKPVAKLRIHVLTRMTPKATLEKLGLALGQPDEDTEQFGHTFDQRLLNNLRDRKENFAPITLKDKYGHEAITTPYHLQQAWLTSEVPDKILAKPALVAALALGSLGAVFSQPTLLRKVLALVAMGIPVAMIKNILTQEDSHDFGVVTSEGDLLSDQLASSVWKNQKTASYQPRLGTLAGMAMPGALALDYAYNQWKYGPYAPQDALSQLGGFVSEHPVLSAAGGALLGSQVHRVGRGIGRLFQKRNKQ